jgi:hypothetical protein
MSVKTEKPIEAQATAVPKEESFIGSILRLIKPKQNDQPDPASDEPSAQNPDRLEMLKRSEAQYQKTLSKEERIERSWDFLNDITNKVDALHGKVLQEIMAAGRTLTKNEVSYIHDDNPPHLRSIGKQTNVNKELSSH